MMTADRRRTLLPWVGLAVVLIAGLAIRLFVLNAKGHYGDAVVIGRWTDNMAMYGPGDFYHHDGALYPALLYAYWPIGVLLDGVAQARAIKGISIPFDLALAVVVYLAACSLVTSVLTALVDRDSRLRPLVMTSPPRLC